MKTGEFKKELLAQIENNPSTKKKYNDNYREAVQVLKQCICNFSPPGLAENMPKMLDGFVSKPIKNYDGTFDIWVDFNIGELIRLSLNYENRSDYVYNILGLFTQGYEMETTENNNKRVYGMWHGGYTLNRLYREPNDFIWRAVQFFLANHAKEYGVENVFIENALYM
jgi:hypothetical protein